MTPAVVAKWQLADEAWEKKRTYCLRVRMSMALSL